MTSYPGGINAFMQPPTGGDGLSTPWTGLTSALCGFHQGDLFLVAGRPGMGKSMKGVGRFESRHHEFSEISHYLKHLAGQFGLTVVLLSQLNRECEKAARRPQLSDLKETGSLEEDADVVLFVHRPEQYNRQDPALRGKAEFIIGKQRNGPTGKRNMVFQHEYQRFVEVTNDEGMNE